MNAFVDEAVIQVTAGAGGAGCASFRREKYIPFGGPDGGDGGRGGSVYLVADPAINTLVEFRYKRRIKAANGQPGMGRQRYGAKGEDVTLAMPVGTQVFHAETGECLVDLVEAEQRVCIAQGGHGGLGNLHFKSSTNRAPRRCTPGGAGEQLSLRLALTVLADVGLLGAPNAGKSSLIRAVSAAKPKVAAYPFTTLHPHLGVVRVDPVNSFVMADIPGLLEGAEAGVGLGVQFLKHLSRCRILLHVVDFSCESDEEIIASITSIQQTLMAYESALANKPRWLLFNKCDVWGDCQDNEAWQKTAGLRIANIVQGVDWVGEVACVSAVNGAGTDRLCQRISAYLAQE